MKRHISEKELIISFIADLRYEQKHLSEVQIKRMVEILLSRNLSFDEYYQIYANQAEERIEALEVQ
ncbi:MAG: hypothetical protein GX587_03135 [Bacteroidales bacterium]|nr:hypothetical protein [Bacteroidales bacterium]